MNSHIKVPLPLTPPILWLLVLQIKKEKKAAAEEREAALAQLALLTKATEEREAAEKAGKGKKETATAKEVSLQHRTVYGTKGHCAKV